MNQLFTRLALLTGVATLFLFCKSEDKCRDLSGRWSNREGQMLYFEPDGKALMLIKFGSQFDTFSIQYQYDCKQNIPTLDLLNFKSGPLAGKNLYGILEWSSDSVFRFDAEAGTAPEERPNSFKTERLERYFKE